MHATMKTTFLVRLHGVGIDRRFDHWREFGVALERLSFFQPLNGKGKRESLFHIRLVEYPA